MSENYAAFISYRHVEPDRKWAKWLHTQLETYRIPRRLSDEIGQRRRLGRVFRDEEELAASSHLSKDIEAALERSEFLIVVCSPRTPTSEWVNAEVEFFRRHGQADHVLSLLIEGEPETAFPPALFDYRTERMELLADAEEPLAADVRTGTGQSKAEQRRSAKLRLLATMLGCRFDDLRQREQERRRRKWALAIAGTVTVLLIFLGLELRRREQEGLRLVAESYQSIYRAPIQALVHAHDALEQDPSSDAEAALESAFRVALLHRGNRNDLRAFTDLGSFSFVKRTLTRKGKIYAVISRDGRYVLLTTEREGSSFNPKVRGEVYLLDNESLQSRHLLPCSPLSDALLQYAGFSASGSEVFVTRSFYVDIYDIEGNCQPQSPLHFQATKSPIHVVAGSLNGGFLLGADSKGLVWLMSNTGKGGIRPIEELGRMTYDFASPYDPVVSFEIAPDAGAALTIYQSGRIDLLHTSSGGATHHWPVLERDALAAAFAPNEVPVDFLTAGRGGSVTVWKVDDEELRQILSLEHDGHGVDTAAFSADGRWIVSIDENCMLRIWDREDGSLRRRVKPPEGSECAALPQGSAQAASDAKPDPSVPSGPRQPTAFYSQPLQIQESARLLGHRGEIFDAAFSPDGRVLATSSADGTVRLWDTKEDSVLQDLRIEPFDYVFSLALSSKNGLVAAGTMGSRLHLWRVADGAKVQTALPQIWGGVKDLAFNPDGTLLAVVAGQGKLYVWDVVEDELRIPIAIDGRGARHCAFTPDGRFLVVGKGDGAVDLIAVDGWTTVDTQARRRGRAVTGISIARNGSFMATTNGLEIVLWQLDPFKLTGKTIRPTGASVSSVAIGPYGQLVAAGLSNGEIGLWQTATGERLAGPIPAHGTTYVPSVSFSPNGHLLASGGGDAKVVLWRID